jgi:hypothetical protein
MLSALVGSPPCFKGSGAKLSEQVADSDHLIAMGARSSGSKPSAKNAALLTTLLAKEACITLGALVDDGRLWEPAGKAKLALIGRSLTETKTTLTAGV